MRRSTPLIWIFLATVAGFIGCGKKQDATPTAEPRVPSPTNQAAATPAEPVEPENPTVVFRFPRLFEDLAPLQAVLDQFHQENPTITVKAEPLAPGSALENYRQALAAKPAAADVVLIDMTSLAGLVEAGHLRDLTEEWRQDEQSSFLPGTVQATEYLGRFYAFPFLADAGALFYRTDLLAKHQANPPATWGELARAATEIQRKEPDLRGFVWPVTPSEDMVCAVLEFLHSNGGSVLSRSKVVINGPENVYALSFAAGLITRYRVTPPPAETTADPVALFSQGQAVFVRSWTRSYAELDKAFPGQIGLVMTPRFPSKSSAPILDGWQLAVAAGSRQPKASVRLARHLGSAQAQKTLALAYPVNPAVLSVYGHYELTTARPELAKFLPILRQARPRPASPFYPAISRQLQAGFEKVLRGEATAEQVLAALQEELAKIQNGLRAPLLL